MRPRRDSRLGFKAHEDRREHPLKPDLGDKRRAQVARPAGSQGHVQLLARRTGAGTARQLPIVRRTDCRAGGRARA